MKTGLRLGVSSDRLEELGIKLGSPGYKRSSILATLRLLLPCDIRMQLPAWFLGKIYLNILISVNYKQPWLKFNVRCSYRYNDLGFNCY